MAAAVDRQRTRYADWPWAHNAHVPAGRGRHACSPLDADADDAWRELIEERVLTGRGAARIRRVARTLADLDDATDITPAHLESAALLRSDVP